MNILIYVPAGHHRSPDQQAQAELLISLGHKVILLSLSPEGVLHDNFRSLGASAFSSSHKKGTSIFFFVRQVVYLIQFCRKQKIDFIFSHLQTNALIAGVATKFLVSKSIYFRHNADYYYLKKNKKGILINSLANKVSQNIIAISENVKTELFKENVSPKRITRINLCYNFEKYLLLEEKGQSENIKRRSGADFILLCIARLDELKRHLLAFKTIQKLNMDGYNCSLVCIGEGDNRSGLEKWIKDNNMTNKIFLDGLVSNVADYILATNIQLLLSYSEASNQAVKEGAFFNKTAIVCKNVGDFEDYIIDGVNGYFVNKENPINDSVQIIKKVMKNTEKLGIAGVKLHKAVINKFSINAVRGQYITLLKK